MPPSACSNFPDRRATAQQPIQFQPADPGAGRHTIWQPQLNSEQIRALLARFGQDDGKGGDPKEGKAGMGKENKDAQGFFTTMLVKPLSPEQLYDSVATLTEIHKTSKSANLTGSRIQTVSHVKRPSWTASRCRVETLTASDGPRARKASVPRR